MYAPLAAVVGGSTAAALLLVGLRPALGWTKGKGTKLRI